MTRLLPSSLRARLLVLVVLSVLPPLALTLYSDSERRHSAAEDVKEKALMAIRLTAASHQQSIDNARQLLATLAQVPAVQAVNPKAANPLLAALLKQHSVYANLGVATRDGLIVCSGLPINEPIPAHDRLWYQRAVQRREFSIGGHQIGRITGKPTLNFGYPVIHPGNGELAGVIFAALDLAWFAQLAREAGLPNGGTLTLISRAGQVLSRYPDPESWLGQSATHVPAIQELLRRRGEGTFEAIGADEAPRLYAYRYLSGGAGDDVALAVGVPAAVAFADVNYHTRRNLVLLLAAATLTLLVALWGGDLLVRREVRAIVKAADRLKSGDLTARSGMAPGRDELSQLARSFDEMAAAICQRVFERDRAEAELRRHRDQLEELVAARTAALNGANQDLERRSAALTRSNAELQQFAYVASHDLQEPLRMVASYMQLIERRYTDKLDAEGRQFIAFAADGAKRMQTLIKDLLAYARVGTRRKPFAPTNCETVLQTALENLQVAVADTAAVVTHEALPTLPADDSQLVQLFQNLLANAVKFRRPHVTPQIHVSAQRRDAEWLFSVRDNGIGLEPRFADRIFLIFQRLHSREQYPGTGIGLAVCKKIVEQHGGRIWVESTPGEGATFHFTLHHNPTSP